MSWYPNVSRMVYQMLARMATLALLAALPVGLAWAGVSIGPFKSAEDLGTARELLSARDITSTPREEAKKESLGFIVVSRPLSAAEASQLVTDLTDAGIKDFVYVKVGVYAGRVSVGVYSTRDAAEGRRRQLARQGDYFSVVERTRTLSYTGWLDLQQPVPDATLSLVESKLGYALQRAGETVTPAPAMPPRETAPAGGEAAVLPKPVASKPAEPVAPAGFAAPSQSAQVTTPRPASTPSEVVPPARINVVSPVAPREGVSRGWLYAALVLGAVLLAAMAALAYLRWFAARAPQPTLIGYEPPTLNAMDEARLKEVMPTPLDAPTALVDVAREILGDGRPDNALLAMLSSQESDAANLIQDVLALVQVDTGTRLAQRVTFDLRSLIDDVLQSRHLSDVKTVLPDAPLPIVCADADLVGRVLANVLEQARDLDTSFRI